MEQLRPVNHSDEGDEIKEPGRNAVRTTARHLKEESAEQRRSQSLDCNSVFPAHAERCASPTPPPGRKMERKQDNRILSDCRAESAGGG